MQGIANHATVIPIVRRRRGGGPGKARSMRRPALYSSSRRPLSTDVADVPPPEAGLLAPAAAPVAPPPTPRLSRRMQWALAALVLVLLLAGGLAWLARAARTGSVSRR